MFTAKTLIQAYHQHAKGVRIAGTYLGAALMLAGVALTTHDAVLAYALSAVGGVLGGSVRFPDLSAKLRSWLTGGGVVAITAAIALLAQCAGAEAAALAYCPPPTWAGPLTAALTSLALFAKSGAWVPAPDVARASQLPPAPAPKD